MDQLGNTHLILKGTEIVGSYMYEPFGKQITLFESSSKDRLSFIGKEKDIESNLGDFGVRKYDNEIGRFTSIDPLWEKYYSWTPYHYCSNNPVMGSDPSGLFRETDFMFPPGHDSQEDYYRSGKMGITFGMIGVGVVGAGFSICALVGENVFLGITSAVVTTPLSYIDIVDNTASLLDPKSSYNYFETISKGLGADKSTQGVISKVPMFSNLILDAVSKNPIAVINDIIGIGLSEAKSTAEDLKNSSKKTDSERKKEDEEKREKPVTGSNLQKTTEAIFNALNLRF